MAYMFSLLLSILGFYLVVVTYVYARQRRLIYHPEKNIGLPGQYQLQNFCEYFVQTADKETIQLWHHPSQPGFPTVVYYHGNAYHLGNRAALYAQLADRGFGVLALSYRGYGKSTGRPSEQGLYTDARTAITFATGTLHVALSKILLFGESLGTGVATQMATEYDIGGLVLQSPYVSVAARAAEIYNYIPVMLLIKDKYFTIKKIARVKAPLLIFHGEKDAIIPIAHGRAVHAAATSDKEAIFFPDNGHNDFDSRIISEHVLNFAKKHNLIQS